MASKSAKHDGEFPSQTGTSTIRVKVDDGKTLELAKTLGDYSSVGEVINGLIGFVSVPEGTVFTEDQIKLSKAVSAAKKTVETMEAMNNG